MKSAVCILSGGMDSTTLAYYLLRAGYADLTLISFDYGQRHKRELVAAVGIAHILGKRHMIFDLSRVGAVLGGSALTDPAIEVPHGHYQEETMRQTVVPNRNAIMLSIAWGVAVAQGTEAVAYGAHAGDHFIYPDCRPEFVDALSIAFRLGTRGHGAPEMQLLAPFLHYTKADIVRTGSTLGVPYGATWTCYEGGAVHCGLCGACTERREAFRLAELLDPVDYAQ